MSSCMYKHGGLLVLLYKMHVIYDILLLSVVPSWQKGFWYQIMFDAYNFDHTACTPYYKIIIPYRYALLNIHLLGATTFLFSTLLSFYTHVSRHPFLSVSLKYDYFTSTMSYSNPLHFICRKAWNMLFSSC